MYCVIEDFELFELTINAQVWFLSSSIWCHSPSLSLARKGLPHSRRNQQACCRCYASPPGHFLHTLDLVQQSSPEIRYPRWLGCRVVLGRIIHHHQSVRLTFALAGFTCRIMSRSCLYLYILSSKIIKHLCLTLEWLDSLFCPRV